MGKPLLQAMQELTREEMLAHSGGDAYSAGLRVGRAIREFLVYVSTNYRNPRYTGDWQG